MELQLCSILCLAGTKFPAGHAGPRPCTEHIGEVLIGVALKTISNYIHHLSPVEFDAAIAAEA
jgi:hypothetical protein